MLFFLMLHHPPLLILKLSLTLHRLTLFILTPHHLKLNSKHYRFALSGETPPAT